MKIIKNLEYNKNLVLALGFFDGIHLAHQKLIKEAVKIAKERIPLNGYEIDNYDKGTDFSEYAYLLEVNTRLDEDFNFVTNYDETKSFDENINCVPFSLKEPETILKMLPLLKSFESIRLRASSQRIQFKVSPA